MKFPERVLTTFPLYMISPDNVSEGFPLIAPSFTLQFRSSLTDVNVISPKDSCLIVPQKVFE